MKDYLSRKLNNLLNPNSGLIRGAKPNPPEPDKSAKKSLIWGHASLFRPEQGSSHRVRDVYSKGKSEISQAQMANITRNLNKIKGIYLQNQIQGPGEASEGQTRWESKEQSSQKARNKKKPFISKKLSLQETVSKGKPAFVKKKFRQPFFLFESKRRLNSFSDNFYKHHIVKFPAKRANHISVLKKKPSPVTRSSGKATLAGEKKALFRHNYYSNRKGSSKKVRFDRLKEALRLKKLSRHVSQTLTAATEYQKKLESNYLFGNVKKDKVLLPPASKREAMRIFNSKQREAAEQKQANAEARADMAMSQFQEHFSNQRVKDAREAKASIQRYSHQKANHAKKGNWPKTTFRITRLSKPVKKKENLYKKLQKQEYTDLAAVRQRILSLSRKERPQSSLLSVLVKSLFKGVRERAETSANKENEQSNKASDFKISEEAFLKAKNKQLTVIYHSAELKKQRPKANSRPSRKSVLVIEFDGTIGYFKCNDKGFIELVQIQNLSLLFRKLKRYFDVVVVFRRRNNNAFFKRVMSFVAEFKFSVALFAVVNANDDGYCLKSALNQKYSRAAKKLKGNAVTKKLQLKAKKSKELFVNLRVVERFFKKGAPMIILSTLKLNFANYSHKSGGQPRRAKRRHSRAQPAPGRSAVPRVLRAQVQVLFRPQHPLRGRVSDQVVPEAQLQDF